MGAQGASKIIHRNAQIAAGSKDPARDREQRLVQDYEKRFRQPLRLAAEPRLRRRRHRAVARRVRSSSSALELLANKRDDNPPKKHGNIPSDRSVAVRTKTDVEAHPHREPGRDRAHGSSANAASRDGSSPVTSVDTGLLGARPSRTACTSAWRTRRTASVRRRAIRELPANGRHRILDVAKRSSRSRMRSTRATASSPRTLPSPRRVIDGRSHLGRPAPPSAIKMMGDKIESSRRRHGCRRASTVVPGTDWNRSRTSRLQRRSTDFASEYGFPIAIKAAAGGGGKRPQASCTTTLRHRVRAFESAAAREAESCVR